MTTDWKSILNDPPKKHGIYWVFPTQHKQKYCALYWDGVKFFSGSFEPAGLTHYHEMSLNYPELPND